MGAVVVLVLSIYAYIEATERSWLKYRAKVVLVHLARFSAISSLPI